jgi:uncharacterized damage-inducible protein DinB
MMTLLLTLTMALAVATPQATNPSIASIKATHDQVKGYIVAAAAKIPEDVYAFKPTPEVRSMGQLFGHIADANFGICGAASGQKPPMTDVEKTKTTKADLQAAVAESFKFCDAAYASLTDTSANETVKFFLPGTNTRLGVLGFNNAHAFEHYGNIVTYMRLKGMVPPSSQGGQ